MTSKRAINVDMVKSCSAVMKVNKLKETIPINPIETKVFKPTLLLNFQIMDITQNRYIYIKK